MGNCVPTNESAYNSKPQVTGRVPVSGYNNFFDPRFDAVEGSLFLYKSTILRNSTYIQREVGKMIEKQQTELLLSAFKRQKLHETILEKIDEHSQTIKTVTKSPVKSRRDSLDSLSVSYTLLQDIGLLIELEDMLQSEEGILKSQDGFETLFERYGVNTQEFSEIQGRCAKENISCIKEVSKLAYTCEMTS